MTKFLVDNAHILRTSSCEIRFKILEKLQRKGKFHLKQYIFGTLPENRRCIWKGNKITNKNEINKTVYESNRSTSLTVRSHYFTTLRHSSLAILESETLLRFLVLLSNMIFKYLNATSSSVFLNPITPLSSKFLSVSFTR